MTRTFKHTEMPINGRYITTTEFMERMGWSCLRIVYFALKENRIPGAINVGKKWLIPADAIPVDRRTGRKKKGDK